MTKSKDFRPYARRIMQASKPTDQVDDGRPYSAKRMRSPLLLGMAVSGAVILAAVIMASDAVPGLDLRLFGLAALTLVSAPAGFGKTTLVTDWFAALRHRAAARGAVVIAWI